VPTPDAFEIEPRFCGPPDSGNGGYVCGMLARHVAGSAEVRLRVPPPLERSLAIERLSRGGAVLRDGEIIVAQARPAPVEADPPPAPTLAAATEAARAFRGFHDHWFPTCFVCGPERAPGDGLRIFPGPLADGPAVACPWTPDPSLGNADGHVRSEFLWAALDCGGAFTLTPAPGKAVVLGMFAAELVAAVATEAPLVMLAWPLGADGRKHFAGTALFTAAGALRARARATWIEVDAAAVGTGGRGR
jgi:hypothetical protein